MNRNRKGMHRTACAALSIMMMACQLPAVSVTAFAAENAYSAVLADGVLQSDSKEVADMTVEGECGAAAIAENGNSADLTADSVTVTNNDTWSNVQSVFSEASGEDSAASVTVTGNVAADAAAGESFGVIAGSDDSGTSTVSVGGTVTADNTEGRAAGVSEKSSNGSTSTVNVAGNVDAHGGMWAGGLDVHANGGTSNADIGGSITATADDVKGIEADASNGGTVDVHVGGDIKADGNVRAAGISNDQMQRGSGDVILVKEAEIKEGSEPETKDPEVSTVTVQADGNVDVSAEHESYGIRVVSTDDEKKEYDISVAGDVTAEKAASETSNDTETEAPRHDYIIGVNVGTTGEDRISVHVGGNVTASSNKAEDFVPVIGISAANVYGDVNIDVDGNVKSDSIGILATDAIVSGTAVSYAVSAINLNERSEGTPTEAKEPAKPGTTAITVSGDVTGKIAGIAESAILFDNIAESDILVDGTVSGGEAAIITDGNITNDQLKLTVWKVELNDRGNAVESIIRPEQDGEGPAPLEQITYGTTEKTAALEKSIMYIIKMEQPADGGTLSLDGTQKSHDFDTAKEGETVYLKIDVMPGYELTGAFNGLGEKTALLKDAKGNYYVEVPKGGGVYLSAEMKKIQEQPAPDPAPEQKPEIEPEPKQEPAPATPSNPARSSSDSDGGTGFNPGWLKDSTGWRYLQANGTYIKGGIYEIAYGNQSGKFTFGNDGYMLTGWQYIGGNWYYFNPISDGNMGRMMTGWIQIGDYWYYLEPETGKMVTGNKTIDGVDYVFNTDDLAIPVGALIE